MPQPICSDVDAGKVKLCCKTKCFPPPGRNWQGSFDDSLYSSCYSFTPKKICIIDKTEFTGLSLFVSFRVCTASVGWSIKD